jgi:ubiquinone/menaquinone biosynthesis C-methylase UbiE
VSEGWEPLAAWYDEKQGNEGDLWHRALIDPALLRVLGDVAGQRVLDLACGNGYLARRLARLGAKVTGADATAPFIERARGWEGREPLGITYYVADAAHLEMLKTHTFDVVVCNMALMDITDAAGAIREVGRVLRPRGRFVASLSHPCFDVPDASAWVIEHMNFFTTTVWRKVRRYREVFGGAAWWRGPNENWQTPAYHRPLSWYFRVLRSAGFVVTAFEEPEPTKEFLAGSPQGLWITEVPLHCVIEAVVA